ncbi:hypothetical protein C1H46_033943 [Malus baccata]|uniref:Uncharacterized protein n=1 Tax=Malus baccata TaxID=106549 RepID=A0A540L209_MALBA|nr:hypothetical protein C1H46_033943 [Malus baccata]
MEQKRLCFVINLCCSWAIIASKFKDKTTRQCRRRWYTYLNSDFKKGGWSPEEDMLLCEAQKIFGNRWTEIAKVVSGRTDNAVKNRFSTLCKKRAKYEALAKENAASYINQNDKRVIIRNGVNTDGTAETTAPSKKMRFLLQCPISTLQEMCENISIFLLFGQQKVLQDFLNQSKDSDILSYGINDFDFQLEDLKYLLEDLRSTTEGSRPSWQQPDLYNESPGSSEYSTGSTLLSQTEYYQVEKNEVEIGSLNQEIRPGSQSIPIEGKNGVGDCEKGIFSEKQEIFPSCDEATKDYAVVSALSSIEFNSPIKVTPLFRSLAAGIPSPKFSESERNFLLKTLGEDSPCPNPSTNPSQPPPCKRSLLQSL